MKTAKPIVAGILNLAAGIFNLLVALRVWRRADESSRILVRFGLHGFAFFAFIFGILAVVGGIFALMRKSWGMSLTGAICALFPPATPAGIPAIILVALAKDELNKA